MGFEMDAMIEKFLDSTFGAIVIALFLIALVLIILPPFFWALFKFLSFLSKLYVSYFSIFFGA